ncbi:MAG: hypothetical protein ACKV2Q_36515 [Planctomycetaceae bacterium]
MMTEHVTIVCIALICIACMALAWKAIDVVGRDARVSRDERRDLLQTLERVMEKRHSPNIEKMAGLHAQERINRIHADAEVEKAAAVPVRSGTNDDDMTAPDDL